MATASESDMAYTLPAALTHSNVEQILQEIQRQGVRTVDLVALVEFDTASLAFLLALRRQQCVLHNIPPGVLRLARVYGVEEIFLAQ